MPKPPKMSEADQEALTLREMLDEIAECRRLMLEGVVAIHKGLDRLAWVTSCALADGITDAGPVFIDDNIPF